MPLDAIPSAVFIAIIDCTRMYHHISMHYIQNKILKGLENTKKEGAMGAAFANLDIIVPGSHYESGVLFGEWRTDTASNNFQKPISIKKSHSAPPPPSHTPTTPE